MLTPLLTLTVWFASIPAVVLYVKTNRGLFAGIAAISLGSAAFLSGPLFPVFLSLALTMLIPAVAMGEGYRRGLPARKVLTAGVIAFLAIFLLSIVITQLLGGNINQLLGSMFREGLSFFPETVTGVITDEMLHDFISLTIMMIPFYFIATSVFLTSVTHAIARRICNRTGEKLPGLPPVREWKLPRSFVWFYLLALFAELFIKPDPSSFISAIIANIVPLLMTIFAIQGIAFLFFIGYQKGKGWIPWLGVVGVIFLTPLFSIFSLLGVFDTAFPIRDRFRKS